MTADRNQTKQKLEKEVGEFYYRHRRKKGRYKEEKVRGKRAEPVGMLHCNNFSPREKTAGVWARDDLT